ncbi:hypothetical protein [Listeria cornellensis]|uniref:Uncharacterized protein n=1 Tax=Listeria cornellensis FSL F6-0969 TaxID=1265820 RepID=W7BLX0_9LIST|nr:hypothetical protein [Listeria cornellensis]EUJ26912.1 hypothetical protein PCORN_14010 [Listeria cornellensis FSL F6-0969]
MAIWQFEFDVIPEKEKNHKEGAWKRNIISIESLQYLEEILPKEPSWTGDICQYGKIDETCIEFFYDDNNLSDIHVKLDLRNLTKKHLSTIINFIKINDAVLMVNGCHVKPSLVDIAQEIKKSQAYRFINDPLETLLSGYGKDD